ncbi:hypothetical protein TIFTF001_055983, partial [Ficus carica]
MSMGNGGGLERAGYRCDEVLGGERIFGISRLSKVRTWKGASNSTGGLGWRACRVAMTGLNLR